MKFYRKNNNLVLNLIENDLEKDTLLFDNIMVTRMGSTYQALLHADGQEKTLIDAIKVMMDSQGVQIRIKAQYQAAFGLGERFDAVNQIGMEKTLEVKEKFCHQGPISYCPIPFFYTDSGFGVYIDTLRVSRIRFDKDIIITVEGLPHELPELVFFFGPPAEIVKKFSSWTGLVKLPPKWAFGPWISANRWNSQADIEHQVALMKKHQFPATVLVIEAWSDEATFYIWNGARYKENDGSTGFLYEEFCFDENSLWPNPKAMIDTLHAEGIHLILWQIPAIKKLQEGQIAVQQDRDWNYVRDKGFVARNPDGTPYTIPKGHWFEESMVPDFTNPKAAAWWFEKRRYLLKMGVDGFKTDGGEFIYKDDITFFNGLTGREMRNGLARLYCKAYTDFIGEDRVLFSRAGFTGQQSCPVQWAGDQESTWNELRSVLKAGLSIGMSGVPYWSFDIGGFAGTLPSIALYERSTQFAVFAPIMQWHAEPAGGQFSELMPSARGINDRSPWNIAEVYGDEAVLERLRFHYNLRGNLIPTLYNEAIKSQKSGLPMMRHLALNYPNDPNTLNIEDAFMLGDLLVAPIVYEGQTKRAVYLPEGNWVELWSQKTYTGSRWVTSEAHENRIPAYLKEGSALALNLGDSLQLGSAAGAGTGHYQNLCFYLAGKQGMSHFEDDKGNVLNLTWNGAVKDIEWLSGYNPVQILRSL